MSLALLSGWTPLALHAALQAGFIVRALLRPHREPSSRSAWVVVILVAPVAGMVAYLLLGETSIGRRRVRHLREAARSLPPPAELGAVAGPPAEIPARHAQLFRCSDQGQCGRRRAATS